jgi:hypothetical protein
MAHIAKEENLFFSALPNENKRGLLIQTRHRDFVEIGCYLMFPNHEIHQLKWRNYSEKERKINRFLNLNNPAPTEATLF